MHKRWIQFSCAVVSMIMIANLQYAWTLFVRPMQGATGWRLSDIQWALSLFLIFETWITPIEGWLIDKIGPRLFLSVAGVLVGFGWSGLGRAHNLTELYVLYAIAGIGAAFVYSGSIATALKWFPDKRGIVSGLITAAFGGGSALFIPFIARIISKSGYQTAFLYTGVAQGICIFIAAQFLHNPGRDFVAPAPAHKKTLAHVRKNPCCFNSGEMLRTPHFYMLYAAFVLTSAGGLVATAQAAPVGRTLGIAAAAIVAAVSVSRLANGAGRIFWGWISDHVGREWAMAVPFILQAICLVSVLTVGRRSGTMFIVTMGLVFFTWGATFSLFPAIIGDYFGAPNATSNYGFLYSAKGVASIIGGGIAAMLFERFGNWHSAFYGSAVMTLVAGAIMVALRYMPLPAKQAAEPEMVLAKTG